jgi:hypothetical protein
MSSIVKQKRFHLFVSHESFPERAHYRESFEDEGSAKSKGKNWNGGTWFEIYETLGDGSLRYSHSSVCKPNLATSVEVVKKKPRKGAKLKKK